MSLLTQLGFQYKTDKAFWHRYTDIYETWFSKYKDSATNILEIGILNGASINMFSSYFKNAKIDGIDIYPKTQYNTERIKTYVLNQSNVTQLQQFAIHRENLYDIIIDDGSHQSHDQMITLAELWKCLKPGGIYIIEDLHTSASELDLESACFTIRRWSIDGICISSYLSQKQMEDLTNEATDVIWWKRSELPYNCWKCGKSSTKTICDCGIDQINDGNGSITSCICKAV